MLGTAGISVTFESVSDLLNASAEALAPGGRRQQAAHSEEKQQNRRRICHGHIVVGKPRGWVKNDRKAALRSAACRRHVSAIPTPCLIKGTLRPVQRAGAGSACVLPFNKYSPKGPGHDYELVVSIDSCHPPSQTNGSVYFCGFRLSLLRRPTLKTQKSPLQERGPLGIHQIEEQGLGLKAQSSILSEPMAPWSSMPPFEGRANSSNSLALLLSPPTGPLPS